MLRGLLRSLGGSADRGPAPATAVPTAPPVSPAAAPAAPATLVPVQASVPTTEAPAASVYDAAAQAEQRGDTEGALALFHTHVARYPDDTDAIATLGGMLLRLERLEAAEEVLLPAVRRFPATPSLLFNTARLAQSRMQTDEAIRLYRLALAAAPDMAMTRFMLAVQLLLKGEYREGFVHFRARAEVAGAPAAGTPRDLPLWQGESLHGKRLLVWLDWGGLGDELQFARYLAPLAREYRPAALVFGCSQAGQRLYASIPGLDQAAHDLGGVQADLQIPLLDLPLMFATTLEQMPSAAPYLAPPAAETARWAARMQAVPGRKVGLCWGAGFWGGQTRSDKAIPLPLLAGLARLPSSSLISLQKGPARAELPCPGLPLLDFDADLNDLADTAALIQSLDIVVSVDTSVAHLAGALGKPVILMLKWESGNFWLLDREDSPWYPGMRIVRQPRAGDWESVAREVQALLCA